jgi:DNA invertase Pin-like site-specific DNA recombinase
LARDAVVVNDDDLEGVYDPAGCYAYRLLLGLTAAMSEAELHILKARMLEARMAKSRRGVW